MVTLNVTKESELRGDEDDDDGLCNTGGQVTIRTHLIKRFTTQNFVFTNYLNGPFLNSFFSIFRLYKPVNSKQLFKKEWLGRIELLTSGVQNVRSADWAISIVCKVRIWPNNKICCYLYALKILNPNYSNWRPAIQLYFPLMVSVLWLK